MVSLLIECLVYPLGCPIKFVNYLNNVYFGCTSTGFITWLLTVCYDFPLFIVCTGIVY